MSTQGKRSLVMSQPGIPGHRQAEEAANEQHLEFEIGKQAQISLLFCLLIPLITPWVAGPVALYVGRQALTNIETHGVGQKHARLARIGMWIGLVVTVVSYVVGIPALVIYGLYFR